jgi:hypothetical protein
MALAGKKRKHDYATTHLVARICQIAPAPLRSRGAPRHRLAACRRGRGGCRRRSMPPDEHPPPAPANASLLERRHIRVAAEAMVDSDLLPADRARRQMAPKASKQPKSGRLKLSRPRCAGRTARRRDADEPAQGVRRAGSRHCVKHGLSASARISAQRLRGMRIESTTDVASLGRRFAPGERILSVLGERYWSDYKILAIRPCVR